MRLTNPTPVDMLSLDTDVTDLKVFTRSMTFTSAAGICIHKGMGDESLLEELETRSRNLLQVINSGFVPRISDQDQKLALGEDIERTEEYESLIVRDLDLPPFKGTIQDFELAMSGAQNDGGESSGTNGSDAGSADTTAEYRGRIIGNAQLRYRSKDWAERLPAEGSVTAPPKSPAGMNMELAILFDKAFKELELSCMKGTAYYYVDQIGTAASHSGRGIGKSLMKWVFDRADRDEVPVFVISSQVGLPFYHKLGFKDVGPDAVVDVDLNLYGGSEVYRHTAIIRQPNKENRSMLHE